MSPTVKTTCLSFEVSKEINIEITQEQLECNFERGYRRGVTLSKLNSVT